jgi:ABC-2 type transport system permease protein
MLPEFWQQVSYFNPVVYLINGMRWAFYGVSDINIWTSVFTMLGFLLICIVSTIFILTKGYRIKS